MVTDTKSQIILDAGTRVFPRLGYHNATVEDILQESSVSRSTFYVYFSGKRELFEMAMDDIISSLLETVASGIDSIIERFAGAKPDEPALEQAVVDLLADVFTFIRENLGMSRVFLNEVVGIDEEMTARFHDFQEAVTDHFERLMRFGIGIGFLGKDVNARLAAEFIVAGLIHMARNISSGIGDYDIGEVSGEIVRMLLQGLKR